MNNLQVNRLLSEKVYKEIEEINNSIENELMNELSDDEKTLIKEYVEFLSDKNNILGGVANIFRTVTISSSLKEEITRLEQNLTYQAGYQAHVKTTIKKVSKIFSILKNKLSNLCSYLWQLISQMTTLDEWSIGGTINANVLGIQSGANIQLKFKT